MEDSDSGVAVAPSTSNDKLPASAAAPASSTVETESAATTADSTATTNPQRKVQLNNHASSTWLDPVINLSKKQAEETAAKKPPPQPHYADSSDDEPTPYNAMTTITASSEENPTNEPTEEAMREEPAAKDASYGSEKEASSATTTSPTIAVAVDGEEAPGQPTGCVPLSPTKQASSSTLEALASSLSTKPSDSEPTLLGTESASQGGETMDKTDACAKPTPSNTDPPPAVQASGAAETSGTLALNATSSKSVATNPTEAENVAENAAENSVVGGDGSGGDVLNMSTEDLESAAAGLMDTEPPHALSETQETSAFVQPRRKLYAAKTVLASAPSVRKRTAAKTVQHAAALQGRGPDLERKRKAAGDAEELPTPATKKQSTESGAVPIAAPEPVVPDEADENVTEKEKKKKRKEKKKEKKEKKKEKEKRKEKKEKSVAKTSSTKTRPTTTKSPSSEATNTTPKTKSTLVSSGTPASSGTAAPKNEVFVGPPDEELPGGWPPGWIKRCYARKSGATVGRWDRYWFSPEKEFKLRSLSEVKRFLAFLRGPADGDEDTAFKMLKGRA